MGKETAPAVGVPAVKAVLAPAVKAVLAPAARGSGQGASEPVGSAPR